MREQFKVGDEIVMVNVGHDYNYTRDGSTGTIVKIKDTGRLIIKFDYLSNPAPTPREYWVYPIDKHYVKVTLRESRESAEVRQKNILEKKINLMWTRQPYFKKFLEKYHV